MITAEPALSKLRSDQQFRRLSDFRFTSVLVENLPTALKDSLTRDDIRLWVSNRLRNIGVKVATDAEIETAFLVASKATDERALAAGDKFRSCIYVNVSALKHDSGTISAFVWVQCKRGVFQHPGYFSSATVWDKGSIMYFGSSFDAKEKIRTEVNELMDEFEKDWKVCNPGS